MRHCITLAGYMPALERPNSMDARNGAAQFLRGYPPCDAHPLRKVEIRRVSTNLDLASMLFVLSIDFAEKRSSEETQASLVRKDAAATDEHPSVGREHQPRERLAQLPDGKQFLLRRYIPKLDCAVIARRRESLAVGRESNGTHPLLVADAGAQQFARGCVPEVNGIVLIGDGQNPPVSGEG